MQVFFRRLDRYDTQRALFCLRDGHAFAGHSPGGLSFNEGFLY